MEVADEDVARSGDWLLALAARLSPDVVHLNGYAHGALPFGAPKVVVGHSCVLSWWWAVHGCAPPESWRGYAEAVRRGLAGADRVIAPSAAMLRALDRHYGPLPAASTVVANGLPPPRPNRQRKRPLVLAAGRLWDRGKNIAALAAAAPALPWPVVVAGDGAIGGSRTSGGVRHLGRLDAQAMAAAYDQAAIYALPARYEPFGLSILEAAQRGCALVLGDIDSLRENWSDAAIFVPPDDSDELARAIRFLATTPSVRRAFARRANRRARRFSLARMCRGTLELYRQIKQDTTPPKEGAFACAS